MLSEFIEKISEFIHSDPILAIFLFLFLLIFLFLNFLLFSRGRIIKIRNQVLEEEKLNSDEHKYLNIS